jgi:tRNA (cmo5U34)-methyltransferase
VSTRDRLYAGQGEPGDFVFDEAVARVFPDMIHRSVPGYAAIVQMIELLAARYAQTGTTLYDLGCSLGAATIALARGSQSTACCVIGVDNAPAMLARARDLTPEDTPGIEWRCADVRETPIANASIVVMNFTQQFLPIADRLGLLRQIHRGLEPGGVLVLSEKIAGADERADSFLTTLHHDFKRCNGYSELEISRKRAALEKVLLPESLETHRARLKDAGFVQVEIWFQCFNFVSLVAFR